MDIIRLVTEKELEAIHTEIFINTSDKVTKVTDHSSTRGIIRGNVKTGKKALKDIKLAVSHLFVDDAFDTALDDVADQHGIAPRFAAAQSSTYVRLVGDVGTIYQQGVHSISDNKGNVFDLEEDITIGSKGFEYAKVRSQQAGLFTNVDSYTLINISPEPSGHIGVINEYIATGGRDEENDDTFRQRIKEGPDILARGTLSYLTQAFNKINPNVLRIIYEGVGSTGKVVLGILTVNGIDLTVQELQILLQQGGQYFSLTELSPIGTQSYGVELKNVEYYPIDIEMRLELFDIGDLGNSVKTIQQKFSKLVDFRFWDSATMRVEWEDLLIRVKQVSNVKQVPDQYFSPSEDIQIPNNQFPRFRGFIVYDLQGDLLVGQTDLDPIFYPAEADVAFQESVI